MLRMMSRSRTSAKKPVAVMILAHYGAVVKFMLAACYLCRGGAACMWECLLNLVLWVCMGEWCLTCMACKQGRIEEYSLQVSHLAPWASYS